MRFAAGVILCVLLTGASASASDKISKGTEAVRAILFDPDAAKFTNVREVQRDGMDFICGYVNGKNKFGGYVGAKPFMYNASRRSAIVYGGSEMTADYLSQVAQIKGFEDRCVY